MLYVILQIGKILKSEDINYSSLFNTTADGDSALNAILNLVYTWAGIIAVIVLIISSVFFVTARGNPEQMKRSKDAVRGALIGLAVVILAFTITRFVIGGTQNG